MAGHELFIVYWRDQFRRRRFAYVKARSRDEAYDFTQKKLQKGCSITAVYAASPAEITPQSICLNFENTEEYTLF